MLYGMKTPKEVAALIEAAVAQGWTFKQRSKETHGALYSPDGKTIVPFGGSYGDHRAIKNLKSALRRAGVKLDGCASMPPAHLSIMERVAYAKYLRRRQRLLGG